MRQPFLTPVLILLMAVVLTTAAALPSQTRPDRPQAADQTLSPYFVVLSDDKTVDALPLKSTRADVKIAGVVAQVKVSQVYQNTGQKTLEAIYVFPASTRAAVHALRMTIGPRVVEAQIMERKKARETYEQAKQEGKTTSLLEQQRPNVFQMNVANILPGDVIKVELTYLELLTPQDQMYEFVLPTVVGPRYSNMPAAGAPDTEKWVQNPYLHEGQAPSYTFGLGLEIHTGVPLAKLASPSHDISVTYSSPTAARVGLKDEARAGTKDFVLRYGLAGDKIDTGLLLYPGQEENFFLLMLEPPARVAADAVLPREYIFIVDVSGSMHGYPLDTAKALVQDLLSGLKPQDFLNVLLFESDAAVLSESGSLPATAEHKQKALAFIQAQPGGGGTEILAALRRALALPRTPGTSRTVVVATDGYVHVEPQVFEMIRQNLGAANLFPFGIGTAVNRHLIEGMARAGLGEPFVVLNRADAAQQAARFRQYIANPLLTDIKVSFEGFGAYEVEPGALPDLFALRPLTLLGKYRGSPTGAIVVQGKTAQGDYLRKIEVKEAQASPANSALRLLWARQRVDQLVDLNRLARGQDDPRVREITALGLKYSLMTPYTSFVAVDQVKRADGQVVTVKQPLPLPEGVSDLAVGGGPRALKVERSKGGVGLLPFPASPTKADELAVRLSEPFSGSVPGEPAQPLVAEPAAPAVKLALQVIQVKGGLDAAAIQKVLEANLAKLAACCEAAVKKGGRLPPAITLTFTVGPDGKVAGPVRPKPPLGHQALTQCLGNTVQGILFPSPGERAGQVTVKLVLTP